MEDLLEDLISLADSLDKKGHYELSNNVDSIIKKISMIQQEEEASEREEVRLVALALLESINNL